MEGSFGIHTANVVQLLERIVNGPNGDRPSFGACVHGQRLFGRLYIKEVYGTSKETLDGDGGKR